MEWTESTVVDRPVDVVHAAVADENVLVRWSAWPAATGYTCSVEGDGRSIGSCIVFRDADGVEQGRQRLERVSDDRVEYRLTNRGPGRRVLHPEVDFRLEPLGEGRTRVHLDFRNDLPLPPVVRQVAGTLLARRVRALHVKDLQDLKAHVESPPVAR